MFVLLNLVAEDKVLDVTPAVGEATACKPIQCFVKALETLRRLLTDQSKIFERTNLVQAQKFRGTLEKAMLGYTNKQVTSADMIARLLELANWVRDMKSCGHGLALRTEENAFYDALAENGSAMT